MKANEEQIIQLIEFFINKHDKIINEKNDEDTIEYLRARRSSLEDLREMIKVKKNFDIFWKDKLENKYGETLHKNPVEERLEQSNARWIKDGWIVEGDLDLSNLGLVRLPKIKSVGGYFYCSNNQLTSLEGSPREVSGYFSCYDNQLTSLEGSPREVGGWFDCSYNNLTSLEGAPIEVGGQFDCYNNQLTTLEGAPEFVGVSFSCQNNQLTSLEGSPREIGGDFDCSNNSGNFTEEDIKSVSSVNGKIHV